MDYYKVRTSTVQCAISNYWCRTFIRPHAVDHRFRDGPHLRSTPVVHFEPLGIRNPRFGIIMYGGYGSAIPRRFAQFGRPDSIQLAFRLKPAVNIIGAGFRHSAGVDYDHSDVRTEMVGVMRFWLSKGVDGFGTGGSSVFIRTGTYPQRESPEETHHYSKPSGRYIDQNFPRANSYSGA